MTLVEFPPPHKALNKGGSFKRLVIKLPLKQIQENFYQGAINVMDMEVLQLKKIRLWHMILLLINPKICGLLSKNQMEDGLLEQTMEHFYQNAPIVCKDPEIRV
jgi:hypothetical protein